MFENGNIVRHPIRGVGQVTDAAPAANGQLSGMVRVLFADSLLDNGTLVFKQSIRAA